MTTEHGTRDLVLAALGLVIVVGCVVVAYAMPATFHDAEFQMRTLTALGGGLLGGAVPGFIGIDTKGVRAVGAAAFVVLFYAVTPLAVNRDSSSTVNAATAPEPPKPAPPLEAAPAAKPASDVHVNSPHIEGSGTINAEYH